VDPELRAYLEARFAETRKAMDTMRQETARSGGPGPCGGDGRRCGHAADHDPARAGDIEESSRCASVPQIVEIATPAEGVGAERACRGGWGRQVRHVANARPAGV